jgi:hypothetical protein
MATTVNIHIIGVAIVYQKGDYWNVIFPVDANLCHKVDFKYQQAGELESSAVSLAPATTIEITAARATSAAGANQAFKDYVYNLTSANTHPKIRKKDQPDGHFVLMTVPNAFFSVRRFAPRPIPDLVEDVNPEKPKRIDRLVHSITGTITLDIDGQISLHARGQGGFAYDFETEKDSSYNLTFNNHCHTLPIGANDMDLYYQVIEEFDPVSEQPIGRRFRIGRGGISRDKFDAVELELFSELIVLKDPPTSASMAAGNTCLIAQVTDQGSKDKLP